MIPEDINFWVENTNHPNKEKVVSLIEEFNRLFHPDPYYYMSDDPFVYRKGEDKNNEILYKKQQIISQIRVLINDC